MYYLAKKDYSTLFIKMLKLTGIDKNELAKFGNECKINIKIKFWFGQK